MKIPRRQYNDLYGPTAGDRIRLADTELLIEITRDLTVPGEEAKFGGGKVIRDGMGQSPAATRAKGALDLVITNAIIIDWWGDRRRPISASAMAASSASARQAIPI